RRSRAATNPIHASATALRAVPSACVGSSGATRALRRSRAATNPIHASVIAAALALGGCAGARSASETPAASAAMDVDLLEQELVRRINAKDARGIVALYAASMQTKFP